MLVGMELVPAPGIKLRRLWVLYRVKLLPLAADLIGVCQMFYGGSGITPRYSLDPGCATTGEFLNEIKYSFWMGDK